MISLSQPKQFLSSHGDRIGVGASVLCAIHCALTPFLLLMMPVFGRAWSSPLAHWIAAAFVIPLACFMVIRGFRSHAKAWILALGILGMSFVLLGAAWPHFSAPAASSCAEAGCCPSTAAITAAANGEGLQIPLAALLSTLGGFMLVATHVGNFCACKNDTLCC